MRDEAEFGDFHSSASDESTDGKTTRWVVTLSISVYLLVTFIMLLFLPVLYVFMRMMVNLSTLRVRLSALLFEM